MKWKYLINAILAVIILYGLIVGVRGSIRLDFDFDGGIRRGELIDPFSGIGGFDIVIADPPFREVREHSL